MAYCDRSHIQARLPELPEASLNAKTDAQVVEGIADAEAEIDGQLGSLYSVPFSPAPDIIKSIAAYLAAAFVLDSGFSGGAEDTKLAEHYRGLAQRRLDKIVSGELLLFPADEDSGEGDSFFAESTGRLPILGDYNPYDIGGSSWLA